MGWKGRKRTPCLTLFVRRRLSAARLTAPECAPDGFVVPGAKLDMLTDVIEVQSPARLHFNGSVRAGASIGHEHGVLAPGSAGLLLETVDDTDQGVYLLSCAHVAALARADRARAMEGQFIEQPLVPAADPVDVRIAALTRHYSPGRPLYPDGRFRDCVTEPRHPVEPAPGNDYSRSTDGKRLARPRGLHSRYELDPLWPDYGTARRLCNPCGGRVHHPLQWRCPVLRMDLQRIDPLHGLRCER